MLWWAGPGSVTLQSGFCCCVRLCSLLVSCLTRGSQALGSAGSTVRLMVTSKGRKDLYQGASSRGRCHCPRPRGGPLLTRTAAGGPLTLAGRSGSASSGVTAPCPGGLVRARFCLCPPRVGAWSPQACGSPVMKSHWPSRSHFLRIPSPFARSPCWEA